MFFYGLYIQNTHLLFDFFNGFVLQKYTLPFWGGGRGSWWKIQQGFAKLLLPISRQQTAL